MALIKCPDCGRDVSDTASACAECGHPFRKCPECGNIVPNNAADMCLNCGYLLNKPAAPAPAGPVEDEEYLLEKIESHLVKSIIATLFFCLPLGILALVHAGRVDSLVKSGSYAAALGESQQANKWANLALIIGAVFIVIYLACCLTAM